MRHFISLLKPLLLLFLSISEHILQRWTSPANPSFVLETLTNLTCSKAELIAENALLRQQLVILHRGIKRPLLNRTDRLWLLVLASRVANWKQALLIIQPDTLLRWHREGFRLFWKRKTKPKGVKPKIPADTVLLIKQMAKDNWLWGSERIRGELLKVGIHVAKRTIQKYMRQARPPRASSQTWSTFLKNHAKDIWACDFLPVVDLFFQQVFIFFIIELGSRRVVHFGVTKGSGIEALKIPYRAPRANAICERFLGAVRRERLDLLMIFGERQLYRVIQENVGYSNQARPHQGLGQGIPEGSQVEGAKPGTGKIIAFPVLGGLHHEYRRAA